SAEPRRATATQRLIILGRSEIVTSAPARHLCFENGQICYNGNMTKEQVKEILDRVLSWPPERQEDAVRVLSEMEKLDHSTLRLTDEQAAEVRRRLVEENPETITLVEFKAHLRRR